jgi:NAD(P)-dependent dehydrogenase (short-subunit alcohol dehydrogenase family)
MMGILSGKVALVTGAARGIGRAIAEQYAAEGAKVVVASKTASTTEAAAAAIRATGGAAIGVACDVSDRGQIDAAVAKAVAEFGGLDILVNNAQSFGTRDKPEPRNPPTAIEDFDEEQWDWVFDSGLKGTLYAMQAAFPHMKAAGAGRIINFGSMRGIISTPGTVAYNVTKEAVRALSRTAANEWGKHGITVNIINPVIATDSYREDLPTPELRQQFEATIPVGRVGQPLDCARVAVFLAGPDSSYMTGMTFAVDGGLTSHP